MIASDVMDIAAAALNDTGLTAFNYAAQIPYLNMALNELQELFEENNIPSTNAVSAIITVPAGITTLPSQPTNLVEIQSLAERTTGTTNDFTPMIRLEFLPRTSVITAYLTYWSWIGEVVKFLGATGSQDVQLNYIKSIFTLITGPTDTISVINGKMFLGYRTAALCAEFIGENPERAASLNGDAALALARSLNISVKGRQSIFTRRRPFMAGYRNRTIIT